MAEPERTPLHILLVDDDPNDRELIRLQLNNNAHIDYGFSECATGAEALRFLAESPLPDCMILDVNMPGMSGYELLEKIKQKEGSIPLPVILLTNEVGRVDQIFVKSKEAISLGAQDYLSKHNFKQETLARVIYNTIERFRLLESQRQDEMRVLDALFQVGSSFASQTDNHAPMQLATNVATELTEAQFGAFFYNVIDAQGESYTLYTIAGVPLEHFSKFPMPRNTHVFAPTFSGEGVIRSYDIRKDPRYGKNEPYYGMPKGHLPVVSYLAVPVVSKNGEVLGGLFFGHEKPGVFTERAERIAKAVATQAAVGIENMRLLATIRANEMRWRNLAEAMPQLVWIDRASDGWCEYLNPQWQAYTGKPTEELLGFEWLKLLHPDDQERASTAWRAAVEGRAEYNIEYRIRRHDGVYRWFKTRGVPIRDENGKILIWYGTCTDIQDLIESRDAAESASIAKSEFLANMSHEIRTPMNAVIGLANLLAISKPLSAKQQEFIKTLQLSADALLSLINDLLDIAKIEAHTVELEEVPFSIVQMVQQVVSIMALKAKEKGLTFALNSNYGDEDHIFLGDPTRMRQIILNLCSNALKFTEKGGVEIDLHFEPAEMDGYENVSISVKDTGIGIAADKVGTIFDKFIQADSSINRKYGGSGLGLAITKTLTDIMGGSISVCSEPDKGSTFTVRIPLRHTQEGNSAPPDQKGAYTAGFTKAKRPHILLVEDYAPNVLVASTFLDQFGYDCDVASNGAEAIEKIKMHDYLLVLMDVQMHGMNGLEATKLLRAYEKQQNKPHLPIIGMTAHALAGDRERCLAVGMDDYIAKPFNPDELLKKIQAITSGPLTTTQTA